MKLIPNRKQWNKWTLPSKYAALGIIVTLVSLVLFFIVPHCGPSKKVQQEIIKDTDSLKSDSQDIKVTLQKLIDYYENEYRDALRSKYTEGYCLFAINEKEIVIPNKSIINERFKIDWNGVTVISRTPDFIFMKIGSIIDLANQNYVRNTTMGFSRKEGMSGPFLTIGGMQVYTEVIDNKKESTIVALGFLKQYQDN